MARVIAPLIALVLGLCVLAGAAGAAVAPFVVQVVQFAADEIESFDEGFFEPSSERADGPQGPTEFDSDLGEVQVFDVLADGTLEPAATGAAAEVWNQFVRMVGPTWRATRSSSTERATRPAATCWPTSIKT